MEKSMNVYDQSFSTLPVFSTTMTPFPSSRGKIKILLLENISTAAIEKFQTSGLNVEIKKLTSALGEADLIREIKDVHVLGIRSKTKVSETVLAHADELLAIGCYCVGTNQVDLCAADRKGVAVFNAPYSNTRSVAELVIGLCVMLVRRIAEKNAAAHQGVWLKDATGAFELRGKTLGIVGYGNIGSQVSVMAEALGLNVIYYDIAEKQPHGNAKQVNNLRELVSKSNIVTLHVPSNRTTRNLINSETLACFRKGGVFLNYSRGNVVDLIALRNAIEDGTISGAAIDVFPDEPERNGDSFSTVLQNLPNVILTPHIGGSTEEAQTNIGLDVTGKLINYLENVELPDSQIVLQNSQPPKILATEHHFQIQENSVRDAFVAERTSNHQLNKSMENNLENYMTNNNVVNLFDLRSHNPSYFAVKESSAFAGELLDFCIPVNLHFPPPALVEMIRRDLSEILRYYPDYAETHQQHIGEMTDLAPETIVPCNGSTEIITLLCQETRGSIITSIPTFSRWTDLPEELNVPLHTIQRLRERDFRLEVDEIVAKVRKVKAQTLVISNPNNPTGAWLSLDEIKRLSAALEDINSVIIDESFIDFSDIESAAAFAAEAPNLVVVKSMGKSLGWHGVRLGYAATNPARAKALRERLPFWNINGLAAYVLKTVTRFKAEYRESFASVAEDRLYMTERLSNVPELTIYPSKANFLFVELPEAVSGRELRDRLLKNHGVLVRECSNKIGSSEQYMRFAVQGGPAVDTLTSALSEELAVLTNNQSVLLAA